MSFTMSETAKRLASLWSFNPTIEIEGGYCSHVYADDSRVLKCPWRGEEQTSGFRAAVALGGWWGPEIFASDEESGSLLMARVRPGTPLADPANSEKAAREVCLNMLQSLRNKVDGQGFLNLRDAFTIRHPLLDKLLSTTVQEEFLHGDLHHFNILWSADNNRWIPIDPKGLVGDFAFEPVAFLRNLVEQADGLDELEALTRDRIAFFSDALELDQWRIAAWGWVDREDSGPEGEGDLKLVYERILGI